jgi:hypothetical protein
MTTSRTVSEAWKCVSTCGEAGIDSRYRTPAGCRAVFQAVHDEADEGVGRRPGGLPHPLIEIRIASGGGFGQRLGEEIMDAQSLRP